MAGIWKLPIIYVCENNLYGMGTSSVRASHNPDFHKRGDIVPGIKAEGQNILHVREIMKWGKQYVLEHGPLLIEFDTYRYHGHSMSDPGITYRTREEITSVRQTRDPIEIVRRLLIENNFAKEEDLKAIEKKIKKDIEADVEKIKTDPEPTFEDMYDDVGLTHHPIRGVELGLSRDYL